MSLSVTRPGLVTLFFAAVLGGNANPVSARETGQTYTITSTSQSASGRALVHEVLSLQPAGNRFRLRVSSADGSMFSLPVELTADGQIASESQDGSVTCYNMAMGVLAHQRDASETANEPPSVFVRFFSSVVPIPLRVLATHTVGALRTIALRGMSAGVVHDSQTATDAGIVIDATVAAENGTLRDATFDETQYIGAPAQIIGRSTCVLKRTLPGRPAITQT
jgi:hypothetical protein